MNIFYPHFYEKLDFLRQCLIIQLGAKKIKFQEEEKNDFEIPTLKPKYIPGGGSEAGEEFRSKGRQDHRLLKYDAIRLEYFFV